MNSKQHNRADRNMHISTENEIGAGKKNVGGRWGGMYCSIQKCYRWMRTLVRRGASSISHESNDECSEQPFLYSCNSFDECNKINDTNNSPNDGRRFWVHHNKNIFESSPRMQSGWVCVSAKQKWHDTMQSAHEWATKHFYWWDGAKRNAAKDPSDDDAMMMMLVIYRHTLECKTICIISTVYSTAPKTNNWNDCRDSRIRSGNHWMWCINKFKFVQKLRTNRHFPFGCERRDAKLQVHCNRGSHFTTPFHHRGATTAFMPCRTCLHHSRRRRRRQQIKCTKEPLWLFSNRKGKSKKEEEKKKMKYILIKRNSGRLPNGCCVRYSVSHHL